MWLHVWVPWFLKRPWFSKSTELCVYAGTLHVCCFQFHHIHPVCFSSTSQLISLITWHKVHDEMLTTKTVQIHDLKWILHVIQLRKSIIHINHFTWFNLTFAPHGQLVFFCCDAAAGTFSSWQQPSRSRSAKIKLPHSCVALSKRLITILQDRPWRWNLPFSCASLCSSQ